MLCVATSYNCPNKYTSILSTNLILLQHILKAINKRLSKYVISVLELSMINLVLW